MIFSNHNILSSSRFNHETLLPLTICFRHLTQQFFSINLEKIKIKTKTYSKTYANIYENKGFIFTIALPKL